MRVFCCVVAIATMALGAPTSVRSQAAGDPLPLEGLIVTATPTPVERSALGASVTLLDGAELRLRGLTRVVDALRGVPGLVVARNGSFGATTSVFFRGAESDHVQVLVDGVQMNQPGGAFDFSSLGTDDVERIEIVRGPGSALYGSDAIAGVIQIITRRGAGAPLSSLDVRAGSFGRLDGSLSLSGGADGVSYGFTASRTTTDGILPFNNRHEQTVLSGQVGLRLDDRTQARVTGRTSERTYGFPTDGSGALVDHNQATFGSETGLGVTLDHRLTDRIDLRALVTLSDLEGGTDDAPDGPADTLGYFGYQSLDAMRRSGVDLRANLGLGAGRVLTLGTEIEGQRVRSFSESLSEYGPSSDRAEYRRDNRAAYAHVVAGWGRLAANAGLRAEDNDQYGRFTTWQAGASLHLATGTRLRAAAGTGVKEPTFFEAFATGFTVGNPDLDPERSRSLEIGLEHDLFAGAVRLQATAFRQTLADLIQYTFTTPEPGGPNFFNVAEARSQGLELGIAAGRGPLVVSLDYTRLDTEVIDAGFDEGPSATFVAGEALLRRPEDQLRVSAGWRGEGRIGLDASVRYVGSRSDRDFSGFPAAPVTLASYTLIDVGADLRVIEGRSSRPGLAVFVRADNLFDREYAEVFGFRAPGRGLYVGGRLSVGGR